MVPWKQFYNSTVFKVSFKVLVSWLRKKKKKRRKKEGKSSVGVNRDLVLCLSLLVFGQVLVLSQNFYWIKLSVCNRRYFIWHLRFVLDFPLSITSFQQNFFFKWPHPQILPFTNLKFRHFIFLFVKDFFLFLTVLNPWLLVSKSAMACLYLLYLNF